MAQAVPRRGRPRRPRPSHEPRESAPPEGPTPEEPKQDEEEESDGAEGIALGEDEFSRQQAIYAAQQRAMGCVPANQSFVAPHGRGSARAAHGVAPRHAQQGERAQAGEPCVVAVGEPAYRHGYERCRQGVCRRDGRARARRAAREWRRGRAAAVPPVRGAPAVPRRDRAPGALPARRGRAWRGPVATAVLDHDCAEPLCRWTNIYQWCFPR